MLTGVAQTAVLTLRARADEHARPDGVLDDPVAADWMAQLAWSPALDAWYADGAQTNVALRADDIDQIVRRYAASTPVRSVVELGCGLSTRPHRLSDLDVAWTMVDLPEVIDQRRALGDPHRWVAGSILDGGWIDALPPGPHALVAEGVLYYLPRPAVDAWLARLAGRLAGSVLVMDVLGAHDGARLDGFTAPLGAPVAWCHEGDLADVLDAFGLQAVPGFSPGELTRDALTRYLPRLSPAVKALSWYALQAGVLPPQRSGNVLGRLGPHPSSARPSR